LREFAITVRNVKPSNSKWNMLMSKNKLPKVYHYKHNAKPSFHFEWRLSKQLRNNSVVICKKKKRKTGNMKRSKTEHQHF